MLRTLAKLYFIAFFSSAVLGIVLTLLGYPVTWETLAEGLAYVRLHL